MGQSLYYSCNLSVKWKLYQNKKILPKTKQANKPTAVVSSLATNTRLTAARRPVLPVGAGASPEYGHFRACRRGRVVTLWGRLSWLQQVLWKFCPWINHKLVCSSWQWPSCSYSREALSIAVLCQMIHRYHAANREVIGKCVNCAQISSFYKTNNCVSLVFLLQPIKK